MPTPYDILGVSSNTPFTEITKAYRRLASIHHPDKGGNNATFQIIQTAYDSIAKSDHDFASKNAHPDFPNSSFPRTVATTLEIQLEDSYYGSERLVSLHLSDQSYPIRLKIPKNVATGDQMRYNVIPNTTLLVTFKVANHPRFMRDGNNLWHAVSVSMFDFIVGTTLPVVTLSGKTLSVTLPPMTSPATILRIQNEGMQTDTTSGDLFIKLTPVLPKCIDQSVIDAIIQTSTTT